ncbi:MAG: hypothetical protein K1X81_04765 [Bacteroidia bacterium]|nr:hypothetical protein [Bacteroidia bacterium]
MKNKLSLLIAVVACFAMFKAASAQSEAIVTFSDPDKFITPVRIQVINLLGEVCIDVHANWDVDNRGYLIDTSMLKSGMYLMLAKDARGNKFQTKMLVRR